jgi:hypothetical protein
MYPLADPRYPMNQGIQPIPHHAPNQLPILQINTQDLDFPSQDHEALSTGI